MRIAYVALGLRPDNIMGGVGRKIHAQMRFWRESGHTSSLFVSLQNAEEAEGYGYRASSNVMGIEQLTRAVSRSRALERLIVDVHRFQPDLIYLRAGMYIYPLGRLYSIAPVIIELNSNDLAQKRLQGRLTHWYHLFTRPLLFRRATGLIAVTREIADLPENRKYAKPTCVIGNGIDLEQYDPIPAPPHTVPSLTLVGSPGMQWQGVDKLIHLAEMFDDLSFHIVGYSQGEIGKTPPNVIVHGFLDLSAVHEVLSNTDVACSTLALHRKGLNEGSALKVPEALAYGIPLLLAYRDRELEALQNECILQLPNTEDNVISHAAEIRSFAYRMLGQRLRRDEIAPCIDQRAKERERLAFFAQVIGGSHRGQS